MRTKEEVLKIFKEIARILNENHINYIIGASCALLVHGLDVLPNDIDIVVDQKDLLKTKALLKDFVYEIHSFPIHEDETCWIKIDDVDVRVNKLEAEYRYYKQREGESEKVDQRIKMIENKLNSKSLYNYDGRENYPCIEALIS